MAHTPYKAQLERYLSARPTEPFSARTLAGRFENGGRDELATLRGIQAELQQAFADGRLVQYRDSDGRLLTEPAASNITSQRLSRPALYGLAGSQPPIAGTIEITYSPAHNGTSNARRANDEASDKSDAPVVGTRSAVGDASGNGPVALALGVR